MNLQSSPSGLKAEKNKEAEVVGFYCVSTKWGSSLALPGKVLLLLQGVFISWTSPAFTISVIIFTNARFGGQDDEKSLSGGQNSSPKQCPSERRGGEMGRELCLSCCWTVTPAVQLGTALTRVLQNGTCSRR